MSYEIIIEADIDNFLGVELVHDDPISAQEVIEELRKQFRDANITIEKDGVKITDGQFASDVKSYEIQEMFEDDARLPSKYRKGWDRDSDLGVGTDGKPTAVWKPKNPEDDYD